MYLKSAGFFIYQSIRDELTAAGMPYFDKILHKIYRILKNCQENMC